MEWNTLIEMIPNTVFLFLLNARISSRHWIGHRLESSALGHATYKTDSMEVEKQKYIPFADYYKRRNINEENIC